MISKHISKEQNVFHKKVSPENGVLVGYGALIIYYNLNVPTPEKLSLISEKHKKYTNEKWNIFTPRHKPDDNFYGHISFALKYEGVDLHIIKELFLKIPKKDIENIILSEPLGKYTRKIWFLYEWLFDEKLNIPDLKTGNFIDLLDTNLQYGLEPKNSEKSSRHRINNNLAGIKEFCPLIRKTEKLERFIKKDFSLINSNILKKVSKDLISRTTSYLLLKDSKASYNIEGESPPQSRVQKWGRIIENAGENELSKDEFLRLQKIVIDNQKFLKFGWRNQGGFIGEHDRDTGLPIPEHISAKHEDIETLISGLINTYKMLVDLRFNPVFTACIISFGFVFIHPFVDGNGRIHRYIINHILSKMNFNPKGFVFPVSASILNNIEEYREVLINYSYPRLDLIDWRSTEDNNIEVLNETIDLYRYFDATKQVEFLFECIEETIEKIIPEEIDYLKKYDKFKTLISERFDMSEQMISLLVSFLNQNEGKFSKRAKTKEFKGFSEKEVLTIEKFYSQIFKIESKS